jgi:hypothetical protein
MNRNNIIFLLLIILLSSTNSCAFHVSIPIASIPKDTTSQEGQVQNAAQLPASPSSNRYEIQSSSGDSVTVTQIMLPIENEGYLSGKTARMFVEIKNNKRIKNNKDLKDLAIRVIIDDELGVIPDSARWLEVYSLKDLCEIKSELYACPLDESPLIGDANQCQNNIPLECNLFCYNNATINDSEEVQSIAEKLSNLYDVNWIDTDELRIYRLDDSFIINNSKNDSYAIFHNNENNTVRMDLSAERAYDLLSNIINNITYINYTNTIIGFNVDKMSPKESIIFYYDVKPKKTGVFNTEVIVRSYDSEQSHLQDFSYYSKIDVKESNPKFDIKPRPSNTEVYKYDDPIISILDWLNLSIQRSPRFIDVVYDITYMGGASEPYCDNIPITFDNPSDERFYLNENGFRDDKLSTDSNFKKYSQFYMYETISIPMRVAFSAKGNYPLPGLLVNNVHYTFNEEKINVDTWFFKHLDIIFLCVSMISLIFTAFELFSTKNELKDLAQTILSSRHALRRSKKSKNYKNFLMNLPEILLIVIIILIFIILLLVN